MILKNHRQLNSKLSEHAPSGYSLFTCSSFDTIENMLDYYTGEDCMKKFCEDLKKHATRIINYEKKKIITLTNEEREAHHRQKECYICKKEFSTDNDDEEHHKVKDHCHYAGKDGGNAHNICNLSYKIPKEIPVVFHNCSTYDYHLIIKELAREFEEPFECLGENTEKGITFSVPIKKQLDNGKTIIYKIKFIDSYRFMDTSLSNLVDSLFDINCEKCNNKREYIGFRDKHMLLECSDCNA